MGGCSITGCVSENCNTSLPIAEANVPEVEKDLTDVLDQATPKLVHPPCQELEPTPPPEMPQKEASEQGALTVRSQKHRLSQESCESGFTAVARNSECESFSSASPDSDSSMCSDASIFSAFRKSRRRHGVRLMITHTMGLCPSRALGLIIENSDTIDKHYRLENATLGKGAFGVVKKAQLLVTNAVRAVKIISKERIKESKHAFKKEVEIMKMVDHPNLLMLYEIFEDAENMYLIMHMCAGGDLLSYVKKLGKLSEIQSALVMRQLLRGVCCLHKRNICHRDLKAENCLFTLVAPLEKNHLKIADFGLSRILEKGASFKQLAGTITHMSPEVLNRKYNLACDLWACGVILYEFLSGQLPFRGQHYCEIEKQILRRDVNFEAPTWITISQKAITYTSRFLTRSVRRRITAVESLHDEWLLENAPKPGKIQMHGKALPNVLKFRSLSRLKRAVLHVMASMVQDNDVDKAREFFLMVDENCDGMISFDEMRPFLDMKTCLQVDKDLTDGMDDLSYTEFIAATLDRKKHLKSNLIKAVFSSFDKNSDGTISISELSTGKLLGHLSPSELLDEIEQVDVDGDMTLDFNEFKKMMMTSKSQLL